MNEEKRKLITNIKNELIKKGFEDSIYYRIFCKKESTSILENLNEDIPLLSNITHEQILKYLNIVKVEKDTYYYSAYPKNIEKEYFSNKYICWITDRFDQALIHPLERNLENPVFFKFKLKKNIYLLNSIRPSNDIIFNNLFYYIHENVINTNTFLLQSLKNVLGVNNFERMNNKYILYIIEAINEIINEECSDSIIINGYKNDFDQKEIALLNFKDLVDTSSIVKYKYTKIKYQGENINLANGKVNYPREKPFYGVSNPNMYRMRCDGEDLKLYYQIEDKSEPEEIFACKDKKAEDFFYAGKYKKYKQKYLELKRLNLNKK